MDQDLQIIRDACLANLCKSIWLDFDGGHEDLLDMDHPKVDCKQRDWRRINFGFLKGQRVHLIGADADRLLLARKRIELFQPSRIIVHYWQNRPALVWDSEIDA